jgi:hypothetical protein
MCLCNSRPYFYFNILEQNAIKFRNKGAYQGGNLKYIINIINAMKKLINWIKDYFKKRKKKKEFLKKIEEIRKRDPFTYNH